MTQPSLNLSPKSKQVQVMFDKISFRYNFLNRLLSFGQDIRWRNNLIKKIPLVNQEMLSKSLHGVKSLNKGVLYDVACGTGDIIFSFCRRRNDYQKIIGFDISEGMLAQAEAKLKKNEFSKILIQFILANAEQLPADNESADCVTIAFGLRNVDDRKKALSEFYRVLKKGGSLIVLEFFPARSSLFQSLFNFYFKRVLPLIGGFFSDKSAYSYLPESVESMPITDEFISLLESTGFRNIESTGWLSGSTMLFKCIKEE